MNVDDASGGNTESQLYWFESELTQDSVTDSQPHFTLPNAGGRFPLSSLQSPEWGLVLRHCAILSYSYARASAQLIMQVDRHITMNRCVSKLAECLGIDHRELIRLVGCLLQ